MKSPPLSFPYTWSNRSAPQQAVIANAWLRPHLEDLTRLALLYGVDALESVLDGLVAEGRVTPAAEPALRRRLSNIKTGLVGLKSNA